jgi:hypothetical protein
VLTFSLTRRREQLHPLSSTQHRNKSEAMLLTQKLHQLRSHQFLNKESEVFKKKPDLLRLDVSSLLGMSRQLIAQSQSVKLDCLKFEAMGTRNNH